MAELPVCAGRVDAHGLPARNAEVAELVDALGLGPSGRNPVGVQISPSAQLQQAWDHVGQPVRVQVSPSALNFKFITLDNL